jgi:hypothetical protein
MDLWDSVRSPPARLPSILVTCSEFAVPKACPDADDTAKALIAFQLRGRRYSPQALIDQFEREHHFTTYLYETHTSVSTNANVLTALVLLSDDGRYQPQIEKCIRYLCEAWFHCDRMVKDKWVC